MEKTGKVGRVYSRFILVGGAQHAQLQLLPGLAVHGPQVPGAHNIVTHFALPVFRIRRIHKFFGLPDQYPDA